MLSKNHPIILFIDRFGFSVYQDTLTNIPKFNFTPDLVANLDVINKEQFVNLIATFIQINKIVGSSLAIILSDNAIYVKDLAILVQKPTPAQGLKVDLDDDKSHEDEVQNFLEDVPFEEILAKVIKTGSVNRIVAVNKDLVMAIIDAFAGKGSVIESIIPSFMYGQNANFTQGLTLDSVKAILGSTEILRSGNLLTDQEKIISSQNLESELKNFPSSIKPDLSHDAKKPRNLRQYILIGIFLILLVILVIVYFTLGASSKIPPKTTKAENTSIDTVIAPTVIQSIEPTLTQGLITTASIDLKGIKVKIIQSSQEDEKAVNLKNELLKIGIADITNEVSEVSIPEKSSVIFSQGIPADLRDNIVIEIKKILPDISILENQDSNFTVNVLIGKS